MNKQESKYFNTASLFDEALIILLEEKDIEYITIKEICSKAGFNRSTFYLHYESIYDLLNETLEYIINKFVTYFDKEPKVFIDKIDKTDKDDLNFINENYLRPYLEFVRDNKKLFLAVFKHPNTMKSIEAYADLEKYILNPILDKYNISDCKKKYYLQFYIHGIMGVVREWITNDCADDLDNIMNIIIECVRT